MSEWRAIHMLSAAAIVVAFVGFFVGTRGAHYEDAYELEGTPHSDPSAEKTSSTAGPARSYGDLMSSPWTDNEHFRTSLEMLEARIPGRADDYETSDDVAGALADRAKQRAYPGAPPTVPHPVEQRGDLACLACHQNGVDVDGVTARPMSHDYKVNCTQCHVTDGGGPPFAESRGASVPTETTFEARQPPGDGPRAWPGAPPQMPHSAQMRSRCVSCHGPAGRPGLRTDHAERQSCTQCHTPSAELNRRQLMDLPFVGETASSP